MVAASVVICGSPMLYRYREARKKLEVLFFWLLVEIRMILW